MKERIERLERENRHLRLMVACVGATLAAVAVHGCGEDSAERPPVARKPAVAQPPPENQPPQWPQQIVAESLQAESIQLVDGDGRVYAEFGTFQNSRPRHEKRSGRGLLIRDESGEVRAALYVDREGNARLDTMGHEQRVGAQVYTSQDSGRGTLEDGDLGMIRHGKFWYYEGTQQYYFPQ